MPIPLIAAGIGAAGTLGGAAISASSNHGMPNVQQSYTQGPDFQQGQTATNDWLNQITKDQNDPNWGAISPDWNDIWQQTQKQVQQYYNGTATNPGVNDQVKASFAQRGMSGDPAASFLTAQSGANEASDLNNAQIQQNIAKQTFANAGKTQWLQSVQAFQNQVANGPTGGAWNTVVAPTPTQQIGNAIGAAGSALGAYGVQAQGQQNQLDWLNHLMTTPNSFAPGVSPSNTAPYTAPKF